MEAFGIALAIVILILWKLQSGKNDRLLEDYRMLSAEFSKLRDRLEKLTAEFENSRGPSPPPTVHQTEKVEAPPVIETPPSIYAESQLPVEPVAETQEPAPPPLPRPVPVSIPRQAPPAPSLKPRFDWEALVGVKLFSWIAGIALVFAAIFFLKYSVDHGWLGPPVRMAIGLLTGAALLGVCEWKAARRYAVTASALDAAGIAILFSTFYASHAIWNLIGVLPTFAALALVTATAVLLSIRHDSLFVAVLGLLGGFATPALLSTGEDRPIGLFGYLLLLNAGLAWVAYKKRWPHLALVSVIFTTIYQWAWVLKFLQARSIPLALGIFLVFPVLSFVALALGEKRNLANSEVSLFEKISAVSIGLPLLFAVFLAVIPAYGTRYWLLFGFLFLVDAGLAVIASKRGPEQLHLAGGITTVTTLCIWLERSYTSDAWPVVLGITSAFVLFYLGAGFWKSAFKDDGLKAVFVAPLLLVVFPVLAAIEPSTASPVLLFAVLFALMVAIAAFTVLREHGGIHYLAAFFALAAQAIWSAKNLSANNLLSGLTIYAIFGLFYLGVPQAARRWNKVLKPEGSGAVVLFASLGLLFFLATGPVAPGAIWGISLLLVILNLGLILESASSGRPAILLAGLVVSWIVIAVWWATVPLSELLIPGLLVVGGFALMILTGNLWAAPQANARGTAVSSVHNQGVYLALVGHIFLLFVVLQKPLAIPPWPFLAVLAVLDLAIGVAALYSRRGELHLAALSATQIILIVWQLTVESSPWPAVAVVCALIVSAMGLIWFFLARKEHRFAAASVAASALGMGVVLVAETLAGIPGIGLLIPASALLLIFILAIAWKSAWRFLAPASVLPTALIVWVWSITQLKPELWSLEFVFAASIYAIYLAYPFWLGDHAGSQLEPYLAPVLASAAFFYFGRQSLVAANFSGIGLLPVVQAGLMAGLLWRLLRLEPDGSRTPGRLAMIAGAVLAFVTVAIPLQLEKQWITIGWALLAASLSWLWRRIPHQGLLLWSYGLLLAVFLRLVLNPAVFTYYPRGAMPFLNWYLYTYLVSAMSFFATAWLLRQYRRSLLPGLPSLKSLAAGGGTILLFVLLNIEIADYYSQGMVLTFNFSSGLAQDLTYTIGWGVFAFGLLTGGILLGSRPGRVSAIALLSGTIAKCFLHDLWRLGGLYRVGSFAGLAVCLTLVALLLQRFVLRPQTETE